MPTERAVEVARLLLEAAEDDPLMTIPEVAAIIGCADRNARRWLEKLHEQGLVVREHEVVERGRRPVSLNRLSAPGRAPAPICAHEPSPDDPASSHEEENGPGALDGLDLERGVAGLRDVPWEGELPPFPGCDVVCGLATTPPQPTFGPDRATDINLILRAYRCVHLHRTGKRARIDKAARFRMPKAREAMLLAGVRAPYAWAMFRFVQHSQAGAARPKIDSVFNTVSPAKFGDWFAERRQAYMQPQSLMTPSHRRLVGLWRTAREALAAERPTSRLAARSVVERHLNPALYAELVAKARDELGVMNANAQRRMAEGAWVWGDVA